MTKPRSTYVTAGEFEVHVTEWGEPSRPALVMWHGLARTGRDFDELAEALSDRFFILCPDTIGRGLSTWSRDPDREYSLDYYAKSAAALLDHYGLDSVGWIGTSMGGIIGLRMASGAEAGRLDWLILNDIGPEIPDDAIARILTYAGNPPDFATLGEAEAWFRTIYAPFGAAPEAFWRRMSRSSVRRLPSGRFTAHYDPKIVVQFDVSRDELTSWDRFRRITIPLYAIAGAQSDILTADILRRMQDAQPTMGARVLDGFGHAPSLARPTDADWIRAVIDGLSA